MPDICGLESYVRCLKFKSVQSDVYRLGSDVCCLMSAENLCKLQGEFGEYVLSSCFRVGEIRQKLRNLMLSNNPLCPSTVYGRLVLYLK